MFNSKGKESRFLSCQNVFAFVILLAFSHTGCQEISKAQQVVDRAQAVHGSELLDQASVAFVFRDRFYRGERNKGQFTYHRVFADTTGEVHDTYSNDFFTRSINGQDVELPEEQKTKFTSSVNSVIYFAYLPYFLNDKAVQKEYLGEVELKGQPYEKVRITFAQEGGGEDYEDTFVYWFHKDKHTLDFMAYSFQVDGGGTRFREAFNPRQVNGVRFQDYINYKTDSSQVPLEQYDRLFINGHMIQLSKIELENVQVVRP
jgi:hypothetical protein